MPAPETPNPPTPPAKPAAATASAPPAPNKSVELLLDVNVNLTLRFGQQELTLREILDLGPGSVVELDKTVEEPAELLLEDKLVARGQVVIVDGNYGLKITELPVSR